MRQAMLEKGLQMNMPDGFERFRQSMNLLDDLDSVSVQIKHQKYILDLMKEMAEALEQYEQLVNFYKLGHEERFICNQLKKFKEWK